MAEYRPGNSQSGYPRHLVLVFCNRILGPKITTSAEQVTTGDLNGDGRDDLIGVWSDGVWVRYAVSNQWQKITASKPIWITTGRTADAIQAMGGIDDPDESDENVLDISDEGPGASVMNVEHGSRHSLQNNDGRE